MLLTSHAPCDNVNSVKYPQSKRTTEIGTTNKIGRKRGKVRSLVIALNAEKSVLANSLSSHAQEKEVNGMVDFEMLSVSAQKVALEKVVKAANSSSKASSEQLAQVFSDIVVSVIREYDRQINS